MENESDSVAKEMNRELFLAPELVEDEDDDEDPLLDQARENVAEEVDEAEERRENQERKP